MLEKQFKVREIYKIFSNILEFEIEVGKDITRSNTPEWNSLKHMEIMFSLEELFDMQFTEEELITANSIDFILKRLE